jgi:hypothetical protein
MKRNPRRNRSSRSSADNELDLLMRELEAEEPDRRRRVPADGESLLDAVMREFGEDDSDAPPRRASPIRERPSADTAQPQRRRVKVARSEPAQAAAKRRSEPYIPLDEL